MLQNTDEPGSALSQWKAIKEHENEKQYKAIERFALFSLLSWLGNSQFTVCSFVRGSIYVQWRRDTLHLRQSNEMARGSALCNERIKHDRIQCNPNVWITYSKNCCSLPSEWLLLIHRMLWNNTIGFHIFEMASILSCPDWHKASSATVVQEITLVCAKLSACLVVLDLLVRPAPQSPV